MIIDGSNLVLGRLASFAAKKALEGEQVTILNCEKVIITGNKVLLKQKFKARLDKGNPYHGPFYPRMPDLFVKRTIRGMLPYRKERGEKAFKKIKCYMGIPENFKTAKLETLQEANASKLKTLNFLTINNLVKQFGKGVE